MTRVLVVDDEANYRRYLERILGDEGHEVRTEGGARSGIEVGSRFRPDVLVVDWMLRDDLHGLHVSAVLRSVVPRLQSILITGFPSHDLKSTARGAHCFDFMEKPFEPEDIRSSVRRAIASADSSSYSAPYGVIEVDEVGGIRYASPVARAMIAERRKVRNSKTLEELFGHDPPPDLDAASEGWCGLRLQADPAVIWKVRSQPARSDGSRLLVVNRPGERGDPSRVEMLLGVTEHKELAWSRRGRVLVVDDELLYRRLAVETLERAGASCYAAENHTDAMRLLSADPGFSLVILDYGIPDRDPSNLVRKIRATRPDVSIIGTSDVDRRAEFRARGVERFLEKGWRLSDLVALLDQ